MKLNFEMPIEMVEKALGMDDPEASIEIKNYIVAEFVRRHLKDVANEKIVRDASEAIQAAIDKHIKDQIGNVEWKDIRLSHNFDTRLKQRIVDSVNKLLNDKLNEIDKTVKTLIDSAFQRFTEEKLSKIFDEKLENLTKNYIESEVNNRIKKIVEGLSK